MSDMSLAEFRAMLKGWRGRRLLVCRTIDQLDEIISALASDDGSDPPPSEYGLPTPPNAAQINELHNMAKVLFRMIILWNDGNVSPQKLPRF